MSDCPNCGSPNWDSVKPEEHCENCGAKKTGFKKDADQWLIYCADCGHHRSTWCDEHPREHQKNMYPTIIIKKPE